MGRARRRRPPIGRCRAGAVRTTPHDSATRGHGDVAPEVPRDCMSRRASTPRYARASVRRDVAMARCAGPRPSPGVARCGHPLPEASRGSGWRAPSEEGTCMPADRSTHRAAASVALGVPPNAGRRATSRFRAWPPATVWARGRRSVTRTEHEWRGAPGTATGAPHPAGVNSDRASRDPTSRTGPSTRARRRTRRRVARLRRSPPGVTHAVPRLGAT